MRYGTNHFRSLGAAISYYARQHVGSAEVHEKIKNGEIVIGKPAAPVGAKVRLIDGYTRYEIEEEMNLFNRGTAVVAEAITEAVEKKS